VYGSRLKMEGSILSSETNNDTSNLKPEKWVNLEDVANHLSVSTDTIRAWIRKGTIPYSRAGKQYKFRISEVDKWVIEGKIKD
jgi:excisionase family DNA binding protein